MNLLEVALGIITGIGGFLEVGSIATSADGGASFRFQLIWALALATVCLIFLTEMSGRLAAVSKHSLADAVREEFGFNFTIVPRAMELIVNFMVLTAELGGVCMALKLVTGWPIRVLAIPVMLTVWLMIWAGTLKVIENGTSILGLIALCFVVAAWKHHPPVHEVLHGLVPTLPHHDAARYWFFAISIVGATIAPFMLHFYSSGAIEDKWDEKSLGTNRVTSIVGMMFGGGVSVAVIVVAAMVFFPLNIQVSQYEQVPLILFPMLGRWALPLFAVTLGVCCFGAAIELALGTAYMLAQTLGWNWDENDKPHREARFAASYTILLLLCGLTLLTGLDPLKLTMYSMALTAVILPFVVVPFLMLMNNEEYLHEHTNGPIGNAVVIVTIILSSIIAIVTIPLQLAGGGG
ncbi:MAG TPA: divalent metal cation transporter [Thermoanaerobaculia bacterium]|jgi:Mn2+/Fe2+ NRAMP family transporter